VLASHVVFGKHDDVVAGSSSSGCQGGEEENADTVHTLQEELHEVKQELATLKANMAIIVESQVENRVSGHLPILI
jgi:hypothetical protein